MSLKCCRSGILIGLLMWAVLLPLGNAQPQPATVTPADETPSAWRERFTLEVDHRLDVPPEDQVRIFGLLHQTLTAAFMTDLSAQTVVIVDRSPQIQAAFIVLKTPTGQWQWLGATAVSTGKPGRFEHFLTPLGVFTHTPGNPDYRSRGTYNKNHIRGYGLQGMRVFDFGWQFAERGWGAGGTSQMRLAMHATDPTVLEPRLGQIDSEGCIRIPATLNRFLDTHGVLDAGYEAENLAGKEVRIFMPGRSVISWPGRFLVVVDSNTLERPAWSPGSGAKSPATKPLALKAKPSP
jgi:hypothetical protein